MSATAIAAEQNGLKAEAIKDWRVICNEASQCVASQVISVQRDDKLQNVLTLTLVKAPNGQVNLEYKLPFGLDLRPGIVSRVDQGAEENFPFVTCMPDGCISVMQMTEERMNAFRKGAKLTVGFRPLGDEKTLAIEASLSGFTAASSKVAN
jgi:invasion protein IalB